MTVLTKVHLMKLPFNWTRFGFSLLFALFPVRGQEGRPNILLIIADDMG